MTLISVSMFALSLSAFRTCHNGALRRKRASFLCHCGRCVISVASALVSFLWSEMRPRTPRACASAEKDARQIKDDRREGENEAETREVAGPERNDAPINLLQRDFGKQRFEDEDVEAEGWVQHAHLDRDDEDDAPPDEIEAQSADDRHEDRHRQKDQRKALDEHAEKDVKSHDHEHDLDRLRMKDVDEAEHRLRHAGNIDE